MSVSHCWYDSMCVWERERCDDGASYNFSFCMEVLRCRPVCSVFLDVIRWENWRSTTSVQRRVWFSIILISVFFFLLKVSYPKPGPLDECAWSAILIGFNSWRTNGAPQRNVVSSPVTVLLRVWTCFWYETFVYRHTLSLEGKWKVFKWVRVLSKAFRGWDMPQSSNTSRDSHSIKIC